MVSTTVYVNQKTIWDISAEEVKLHPWIVTKDNYDLWADCLDEFLTTDIFSCDIETFGEPPFEGLFPWKGYPRLITVGLPSERVILVDLGGWRNIHIRKSIEESYSDFFEILKAKCEDPSVSILGVYFKFDALFLRVHYGIKCLNIRDLTLLSQILYAGVGVEKATKGSDRTERCTLSHSLKGIFERSEVPFDFELDKSEQTSAWGWDLTNSQLNYAALDSKVLFPLFFELKDKIAEAKLTFSAYAECFALSAFVEQEYRGWPVDLERTKELLEIYQKNRDDSLQPFLDKFPGVLWSSNEQVLACLNEAYPELKLTSVGSEVLEPYCKDYPELKGLMDARTYSINISNLETILSLSFIDPDSNLTSIRTHFTPIASGGSGRSSCRKSLGKKLPNTGFQLQNPSNLPGEWQEKGIPGLREVFSPCSHRHAELYEQFIRGEVTGFDNVIDFFLSLPEDTRPKKVVQILDLSQAHQRIACELYKDPTLISIYNEDRDAHVIMGKALAAIKGIEYANEQEFEKCVKAAKKGSSDPRDIAALTSRKAGKVGNYSGLNLGGVYRIQMALLDQGIPATEGDAREVQRAWRSTYTVLYKGILSTIARSNAEDFDFSHFQDKNGLPLGGKYGSIRSLTNRRLFGKKSPNKYSKGKMEVPLTDMCAFQWLGAEADIIKYAMGDIHQTYQLHPVWDSYICNFAHDELNIIHSLEYAKEAGECAFNKVKSAMEMFIKTIPVIEPGDVFHKGICTSWSQK